MSSRVSYQDQFLWMSNREFDSMMDFLLEVGTESAVAPDERAMVARLSEARSGFFSGYGFDLEKEFPTVEERKFWARCFHNLARAIFLRKVGNQEADCWQSAAIANAHFMARFLTQAVGEVEPRWCPVTDDGLSEKEYFDRLTSIRL